MPAVIVPLVLIAVLVLLLMSYYFFLTVQKLITALGDNTPVIGKYIRRAGDAVARPIEHAWNEWINPHVRPLVNFFTSLATVAIELPTELGRFVTATVHVLDTFIHVTVHQIIKAFLAPINAAVRATEVGIDDLRSGLADARRSFTHGIDALRRTVETELARLGIGIDRLDHLVDGISSRTLLKGIDTLQKDLAHDFTIAERDIRAAERDLRALAHRLDIPIGWVEAIAGTIGAVAAVKALTRVIECEAKLAPLCRSDTNEWLDFLGVFVGVIAFPGLRALTEMAAGVLEEMADDVREMQR